MAASPGRKPRTGTATTCEAVKPEVGKSKNAVDEKKEKREENEVEGR